MFSKKYKTEERSIKQEVTRGNGALHGVVKKKVDKVICKHLLWNQNLNSPACHSSNNSHLVWGVRVQG